MNSLPPAYALERTRMEYALVIAVFGLGVSAALVVLLVFGAGMKSSADIVAIVGTFTSVSGTLVGTFFGLQIGSSGRAQEQADLRKAEKMSNMAFMVMTKEQQNEVMEMMKTP